MSTRNRAAALAAVVSLLAIGGPVAGASAQTAYGYHPPYGQGQAQRP